MTEKQKKQLAVQKAVKDVMEAHMSIWHEVPEMKSKYDQFIRNLKKIEDDLAVLGTDLAPLKEARADSRKQLIEQLFPVTSVLGVYASDAGDKKLGKLADTKFSDLEEKRVEALVKYGRKILSISEGLTDPGNGGNKKKSPQPITDYGLSAKHLEDLRKALDGAIRDENALKETGNSQKKSASKLDKRIRKNTTLLNRKLDRMIPLYRDSHPDFYRAYQEARKSGKGSKPSPPKKKPAAAGTAGAEVKKPPAEKKSSAEKKAPARKAASSAAKSASGSPGKNAEGSRGKGSAASSKVTTR